MPNFCTKCGKQAKPGIKFCVSCGGKLKTKSTSPSPPPPVVSPPVVTPPRGKSGGVGCLVGCLVIILVFILLVGGLIGAGYYFLSKLKKAEPGDYFEVDAKSGETTSCGSSLSCIDESLKTCSSATGEANLGEFAEVEFEVLGTSGSSCVVFVKIVDIKELPDELDLIPDFILNSMFKDLSMECLVPKTAYSRGMEYVGEYIGENMTEACKGPLFDMAEKFGIDLEDL